ncbi:MULTISPECIES: hypothetical protein [Streptomyces]|uniref:hypothetical protein n=1 Tax=Streptomyces TaxID=1883 RepID=UPI001CEC8799|nr:MULTISPECIES: hypothetical protein [Streptomyces]MDI5909286.1 hypothetical protein [Streptomyces sp. 12257]
MTSRALAACALSTAPMPCHQPKPSSGTAALGARGTMSAYWSRKSVLVSVHGAPGRGTTSERRAEAGRGGCVGTSRSTTSRPAAIASFSRRRSSGVGRPGPRTPPRAPGHRGHGDAHPVLPGKRYLDRRPDDPAGQRVEAVRPIRDGIQTHAWEPVPEVAPR